MLDINAKQRLQQADFVAVSGTGEGVESRYCPSCRAHIVADRLRSANREVVGRPTSADHVHVFLYHLRLRRAVQHAIIRTIAT